MIEPTEKQQEILDFIKQNVEAKGFPPSLREIATRFNVQSTAGMRGQLLALQKKGKIEIMPNTARGIKIL